MMCASGKPNLENRSDYPRRLEFSTVDFIEKNRTFDRTSAYYLTENEPSELSMIINEDVFILFWPTQDCETVAQVVPYWLSKL